MEWRCGRAAFLLKPFYTITHLVFVIFCLNIWKPQKFADFWWALGLLNRDVKPIWSFQSPPGQPSYLPSFLLPLQTVNCLNHFIKYKFRNIIYIHSSLSCETLTWENVNDENKTYCYFSQSFLESSAWVLFLN